MTSARRTPARRTAVVTIAHGRHEHLLGQRWGLARQTTPPDLHVVVAMGDPEMAQVVAGDDPPHVRPDPGRPPTLVVAMDTGPTDELPLAQARNIGARTAIDAGADLLVFLDVDCIPAPRTLERYAAALAGAEEHPELDGPHSRPVVACGAVAYLPPVAHPADYRTQGLADLAGPHPARPHPADGEVVPADDLRLFWSLSFALTAADWDRLGGFSEEYVGYGGEDTDFGQRIGASDGTMLWVGGAAAYHQHHPTESPPVQHLNAIVRNANLFHSRWGWFPMEGWLHAFAERGLARLDTDTDRWVTT